MRTKPIKLYAYSVLVLAIEAEPEGGIRRGSAKKEATYRFRVIAQNADEAESIGLELVRTTGERRELLATVNKVECLRHCHSLVLPAAG